MNARVLLLTAARVMIVGGTLLIEAPASAQQPVPASPQPDLMQQLLTEVRQLRASVERAAGESAALQLVAVRAAMQEERLYRVTREVEALRSELEIARREARGMAAAVKDMERAITEETDSNRRLSLEGELPTMRRKLQETAEKEQGLAQQEGAMSGSLAAEEGRWQDINARLDELERRLASRTTRP